MKRILHVAGIFCAVMLLSACGAKNEAEKVKIEEENLTKDSVIMTVEEEAVTYEEALTYMYFLKQQYEPTFGSGIWEYKLEGNGTINDMAKEEMISMITQIKVIAKAASDQDIFLDNDEKGEMNQLAATLYEEASEEDKKAYFLDQDTIEKIYQENQLATKMFYLMTDDVNTEVSDAEAKQSTLQYIMVMTKGTDRNGTAISMDDATKSSAQKKAQTLLKDGKKAQRFGNFANTNSDISEYEIIIGADDTTHEKAFVDAAMSLKTGQFSDVIAGEEGYYIIYCVNDNNEEATAARKEEIIAERQNTAFLEQYNSWLEKCDIEISSLFWDKADMK